MVLANLLPGFRHTRTPLIAGCLWLLIAWLAFGTGLLPDSSGSQVERRLYALGDLVGGHVVLAALALGALLLGGMAPSVPVRPIAQRVEINRGGLKYETMLWLFGMQYGSVFSVREGEFSNWLHRLAGIVPERLTFSDFTGPECPPTLQVWARDLAEAESDRGNDPQPLDFSRRALTINGQRIGMDSVIGAEPGEHGAAQGWLQWVLAEASINTELASELPLQLQIERESAFNDYDRVRSESELRAAIIIPLTALVGFLIADSTWWALALAIPVWMLRQAVQAHVEADQRLLLAVRHGAIKSSTVEFIRFVTAKMQARDRLGQDAEEETPTQ